MSISNTIQRSGHVSSGQKSLEWTWRSSSQVATHRPRRNFWNKFFIGEWFVRSMQQGFSNKPRLFKKVLNNAVKLNHVSVLKCYRFSAKNLIVPCLER